MFDNLKGMGDIMKLMGQAGKIKENMVQAQIRAKNRTGTGESGAGLVKVVANGAGEVLSVKVDPSVLEDPDTLGPLVTSAVNAALTKGREIMMEETRTAMGGIELPPGLM